MLPVRHGYFHVLNRKPLIVLIPEDFTDEIDTWISFFNSLRATPTYFLCLVRGALEASGHVGFDNTKSTYVDHGSRYPNHELIYLANNDLQWEMFEERKLPTILCNQNALIDESLFTIIPIAKRYDAIYNARISPYKRHYLASMVKSLALITIVDQRTNAEYFNHIAYELKHAAWLNFEGDVPEISRYSRIPPGELGRYINQARVGLCLSENEGAMFASMEYMLCGLPVVTTKSTGGRDVFFDDEYVVQSDASPESVKMGVEEVISRDVAPEYIRSKTILRLEEHRRRFVDLVQKICDSGGVRLDAEDFHHRTFPSQLYSLKKRHSILSYLSDAP